LRLVKERGKGHFGGFFNSIFRILLFKTCFTKIILSCVFFEKLFRRNFTLKKIRTCFFELGRGKLSMEKIIAGKNFSPQIF